MLESAVVMINWRTVSVSLMALIVGLSVSRSPFKAAAQAKPGISPADITVVQYAYKGQNYEIRLYKGELMMVSKDNLPVVMYSRGTAHPIGQDANAVAAAEEAVKAYKAGTPSGGGGASPGGTGAASGSGLTVDGVISLVKAGLSDDLIIAKIQKSGQAFDLSTDEMVRLKQAKASDAVIKAMMTAAPAPASAPATGVPAGVVVAAQQRRQHRPGRRRLMPSRRIPTWASFPRRVSWEASDITPLTFCMDAR